MAIHIDHRTGNNGCHPYANHGSGNAQGDSRPRVGDSAADSGRDRVRDVVGPICEGDREQESEGEQGDVNGRP